MNKLLILVILAVIGLIPGCGASVTGSGASYETRNEQKLTIVKECTTQHAAVETHKIIFKRGN